MQSVKIELNNLFRHVIELLNLLNQ